MWIAFAFGSAFFAGAVAILAKIGIRGVNSNLATALRTIVVLAFAWLVVFVVGSQGQITELSGKTWLFLVLSGLATGGSWLCYFRALQIGDVNKVVPVDKSSVVLTMLLAGIFLGEGFTVVKVAAMVLIGVGTYLMIERKTPSIDEAAADAAETGPGEWTWLIYALGSAVFAALTSILGKVGIEGVESNLGTAIRTVVVLVMAWLIVAIQGTAGQVRDIDRKSWIFLGLSGLATGASWLCFYRALQTGPASVVLPIDKLSILITIAFGFLVFGERLTKKSAIGLAMIVGGTLSLVISAA